MILSDDSLTRWGIENCSDFDRNHLNPASMDLTLAPTLCRPMWYWRNSITRYIFHKLEQREFVPHNMMDIQAHNKSGIVRFERWEYPIHFKKYTLWPGEFVLCSSIERTNLTAKYAALTLLKSSRARMGLQHLFAGWGDNGFNGTWTWEFVNVSKWPITLIAGERMMQLIMFQSDVVPSMLYAERSGNYQGQSGPTASIR